MPSKSMNPMPMQTKIGDASLKFGPDWLRALSSDNTGNSGTATGSGQSGGGWSSGSGGGGGSGERATNERSPAASNYHHQSTRDREKEPERRYANHNSNNNAGSAPAPNRFKLSEFRYTREELLTLYDKNLQAPDYLASFGTLFMEKMQPPLAFSQPSEDELRTWHVPQPESSRPSGNGPVGTGLSPLSRGGGFAARGRGIDRGGRGGRGGRTSYYGRPHEEEEQRFRQHSFSRSVSAHERNWVPERERNGLAGSPPEAENSRGGGGGGNWRNRNSDSYSKSRYEENDDGWRNKPRWRREDEEEYAPRSNPRRIHKSWSDDGTQDNLPEWAKDNPSEESGTFDSSGAFHDEDRYSAKTNAFEMSRRSDAGDHPKEDSQGSQNERVQKRNTAERGEPKVPLHSTSLKEEDGEEPRLRSKQTNRKSLSPRPEAVKGQTPLSAQENHKRSAEGKKQESASQQPQKPVIEEHYRSMIDEEADSLVAKLIEDDAALSRLQRAPEPPIPPVSSVSGPVGTTQGPSASVQGSKDIWFYRDPQGNVQGPFASTEMSLWLNQGYFSSGLFLRRECDKLFVTLGEMGKLYGRNPFTSIPDSITPPPLQDPSNGLSALDPHVGETIHPTQAQFLQQKQQQLIQAQQQQYLLNFLQHSQTRKESEEWSQSGGPSSAQLQQAQMLLNNMAKASGGMAGSDGAPFDLQTLFQRQAQMKAQENQNRNTNLPSQIPSQNEGKMEMDPIQSLLHQLSNMNMNLSSGGGGQGSGVKVPGGNGWGPAGNNSWTASAPAPTPNPLWDYREQYLKMQQMKAEEELLLRKKMEEEQERKRLQEEEEARKRIEEQKRIEIEQEQKRKAYEELLQQQQAAAADLARQREELILQQRLQQQEMARHRLEQEKQRMEALQKMEQQRAEQQRMEQARLEKEREEERERDREREREEQERRMQMQLEEQKRREERRMQQEMQAKKMQEYQQQQQQKVPWNTSSGSQGARTLLEIQEEETLQLEALKAQQMSQRKKIEEEQRERLSQQQAKGLSLTWAQPTQPQNLPIKSLAEIQAEEAAKLEEKRREKEVQTRHLNIQQNWNSNLTWANRASLNAPPSVTGKGNNGGSVWGEEGRKKWDESPALLGNKVSPHSTVPPKQRQKETPSDDSFLKLFQDHGLSVGGTRSSGGRIQGSASDDPFTRWCFETVEAIGGSVDVPTFINFLKEVESPFEVNDYIRSYLGDGKEARDFGREFLERRSRWKNARRGGEKEVKNFEDNLYRPASALNPPNAEFQEVKGKKGKKGKMQKVDARILGFNTTAAPDRLNKGQRDYGDGSDN